MYISLQDCTRCAFQICIKRGFLVTCPKYYWLQSRLPEQLIIHMFPETYQNTLTGIKGTRVFVHANSGRRFRWKWEKSRGNPLRIKTGNNIRFLTESLTFHMFSVLRENNDYQLYRFPHNIIRGEVTKISFRNLLNKNVLYDRISNTTQYWCLLTEEGHHKTERPKFK